MFYPEVCQALTCHCDRRYQADEGRERAAAGDADPEPHSRHDRPHSGCAGRCQWVGSSHSAARACWPRSTPPSWTYCIEKLVVAGTLGPSSLWHPPTLLMLFFACNKQGWHDLDSALHRRAHETGGAVPGGGMPSAAHCGRASSHPDSRPLPCMRQCCAICAELCTGLIHRT